MSVYSSWIHGNALIIESPLHFNPQGEQNGQLLHTSFGWGTQLLSKGVSTHSWIHLPIPTITQPVSSFERFELVRIFLLFECSDAFVKDVHIYDGNEKIAEFNKGTLEGSFLSKGSANTFVLDKPRRMKSGLGLSFFFQPYTRANTEGTLLVTAAGAEYETRNTILSAISSKLFRWRP